MTSPIDPDGPLVEPLTRREQEVLRLLAEGCSRPEIAEKLTVTLSAVILHTQIIYGKLGANSKRQAIKRAGELGLLGDASPAAPAMSRPVNGGPGFQPALGPIFWGIDSTLRPAEAQAVGGFVSRHHSARLA